MHSDCTHRFKPLTTIVAYRFNIINRVFSIVVLTICSADDDMDFFTSVNLESACLTLPFLGSESSTYSILLDAPKRLKEKGIKPLSFFGLETTEPSVICWMPAASVYFRDPDGHTLEYLTMLDKEPRPDLGIISWSKWLDQSKS